MPILVSPSYLKQKAKQISRDSDLKLSQALDLVTQEFGFSNYKHYKNVLDDRERISELDFEQKKKAVLSENDIAKKIKLAALFIERGALPFNEQLELIQLFYDPDDLDQYKIPNSEKVQLLCQSMHFMQEELKSFLIEDLHANPEDIADFFPYHAVKNLKLSNFEYTIDVDSHLCIDVYYDLLLEFAHEYDEDQKDHPFFQDEAVWGTYQISVDPNKKITINSADIGF